MIGNEIASERIADRLREADLDRRVPRARGTQRGVGAMLASLVPHRRARAIAVRDVRTVAS